MTWFAIPWDCRSRVGQYIRGGGGCMAAVRNSKTLWGFRRKCMSKPAGNLKVWGYLLPSIHLPHFTSSKYALKKASLFSIKLDFLSVVHDRNGYLLQESIQHNVDAVRLSLGGGRILIANSLKFLLLFCQSHGLVCTGMPGPDEQMGVCIDSQCL